MRTCYAHHLTISLLLIISASASSQPAEHLHEELTLSDSLSLSQIISATVEHSSESLLRGAKREQANALESLSRGVIPGQASWQLSLLDDRFSDNLGVQEIEMGIQLALWHRNERAVTGALSKTAGQRAQAYSHYLRWLSAGRVRQALEELASAMLGVDRAKDNLAILTSITEMVEKQVQAGELPLADSLRVEAEALEFELALFDAQAELVDAERNYASITGLSVRPAEIAAEALSPQQSFSEAQNLITLAHPLLNLLSLDASFANGKAERAAFTSRNRTTISLGGRREKAGAMVPTSDTVGIGISVPIGGKKLSRPAVVAAKETAVEAEIALQRARRNLDKEYHEIEHERFITAEAITLTESRKNLAQKRLDMALVAFEEAETDIEQLLRIRRHLNEISRELDTYRLKQNTLIARVNQVLGEAP